MELELELKKMADAVEAKNTTAIKAAVDNFNAKIDELKAKGISKEEFALVQKSVEDTIAGFDALQSSIKLKFAQTEEVKNFGQAFAQLVKDNAKDIAGANKSHRLTLELKAVGNMSTTNFGGATSTVQTYMAKQGILPSTKLNLRDLVSTQNSGTLVSVFYRETVGEGAIAVQTEGAAKGQIDYDFSKVEVVSKYIAGFTRFSKQLLKAVPWMESTLPRLMLRDFFTKENDTFFATLAAAATGSTTTAETDDVKQIIDYIANQRTAKFAASYGVVSHAQLARLNKLTYTNGYYTGSGGVLTNVDGSMQISGVPIIPTDWVADDKIFIFDKDYTERVEAESLKIEFFEQDSDNVQKNLITARVECLEAINLMLPTSAIYADLGNVA